MIPEGGVGGAPSEQIQKRESDFHDEWAHSVPLDKIEVRGLFEAPTAPEYKFILRCMGPLAGKTVLDIGAGLGESSVYFALQGAKVTSTDLSPGMIDCGQRLAARYNVQIEGLVSPGEAMPVPENHFDFVFAANVIHHVTNRASLFEQVRRALRPGGWFFSIDPLAYNPIINIYRRMATKVRTPDETPLKLADIALARRYFDGVSTRQFWIATQVLFLKYYLIDRVHPNSDRYWKRILSETPGRLWWWWPFYGLDAILTRLPLLRWWAWNMVMCGQKPK